MDVELAGGPKKQRAVLWKARHIQIFLVGVLLWKFWLHSVHAGGQFTAVSKAARKSSGFLSYVCTQHDHLDNWRLFFPFGQTWTYKKNKWNLKKSVTKSAMKNSSQVAGWQAALFQVPNMEGLASWQLPGCSPKWDNLKSTVWSWGLILFSKLQHKHSRGGLQDSCGDIMIPPWNLLNAKPTECTSKASPNLHFLSYILQSSSEY